MPNISMLAMVANGRAISDEHTNFPWSYSYIWHEYYNVIQGMSTMIGRKSYEELPQHLSSNSSMVLTKQHDYIAMGNLVVNSGKEALSWLGTNSELFIIGGASLYEQALPSAKKLYIIRVDLNVEPKQLFPVLKAKDWKQVHKEILVVGTFPEVDINLLVYERI